MHNPNRGRCRRFPNKLQRRYSSCSPGGRRSRTRHSDDPRASNYTNIAALYTFSQSRYPALSKKNYRYRPANDPLVVNPRNFQIQDAMRTRRNWWWWEDANNHANNNIRVGLDASQAQLRTMRSRPVRDPLVVNPPKYRIQATGQGAGVGGYGGRLCRLAFCTWPGPCTA
jgi:hypothetical protein